MSPADLVRVLVEPFTEPIVQRAAAGVVLLGIVGGLAGCWVVLYGLSYAAESLAHGSLPGMVVAVAAGLPLLIGTSGGLLVAAAAIALVARVPALGRDTAVSIVISTMLGLGALLALAPSTPRGLAALLFGDVLGLSTADLAVGVLVAALLAVLLTVFHGRLLAVGFDRESAARLGVRPGLVELLLLVLLGLALVVVVPALGNLLAAAILIGPAATARLVTRRVPSLLAVAVLLAIGCGLAGLEASYQLSTASGATIAATILVVYLLALGRATLRRRSVPPAGSSGPAVR
ncbi:MAG TPA: metal ABC transporter permease [Actinomycetota bacterium]|nr:metal ABC transporter permease [Actinomycetota bacterium]